MNIGDFRCPAALKITQLLFKGRWLRIMYCLCPEHRVDFRNAYMIVDVFR